MYSVIAWWMKDKLTAVRARAGHATVHAAADRQRGMQRPLFHDLHSTKLAEDPEGSQSGWCMELNEHAEAPAVWKLKSCMFIQDQSVSFVFRSTLTEGLIVCKPNSTTKMAVSVGCAEHKQLVLQQVLPSVQEMR